MIIRQDGTIQIDTDCEMIDAITKMGSSFRGLWQYRELKDDELSDDMWCVTFVYKGNFVDTPLKDSIYKAFNFALDKLKITL